MVQLQSAKTFITWMLEDNLPSFEKVDTAQEPLLCRMKQAFR